MSSMSEDIGVWKSFRYSENCKKLVLGGDTGRKGPLPKWQVLWLEGWSAVQPWGPTAAF